MASSSRRTTMSPGNQPQRGQQTGHAHADALSSSLHNLSLNQASRTPLPPSPATSRPEFLRNVSSPRLSPSPLRRCSSSMSVDRRASSPALPSPGPLRKSSTLSLRNGDIPASPKLGSRRSSQLGVSPLSAAMEEPAPPTANSIAAEYFGKELDTHADDGKRVNTVVILHDACYGHRFSRPKTNKATLSMIVERPERIQASVMGISAAYVRLGERYAGGVYAPDLRRKAPEHLPFKVRKTSRTLPLNSPAVTFVHGTKWMEELKIMCGSAQEKLGTTGREVERPPKGKNEKDKPQLHSGDLYLCPESLAAFEGAMGGVCEGVDAVFEGTRMGTGPSQAFVCVRPPGHHCSSDYPSGFCWLNNVHVGIQHAVLTHGLTHAAIIDFDLHHGDGSQSITWAHNKKIASLPKNTPNSKKTSIGYFSLHDINSYPCEYGDETKVQNASLCIDNAHNQSIWNVHLQPWKTEQEFWELYQTRYMALIEKARSYLRHHTARLRDGPNQPMPKAAIFFSAGFDASEHESEGMQRHKVNVPTDFYARFTRDVAALAKEDGTGVDGRVISVLEGGYSDKALISGVLAHVSGLCHEDEITVKQEPDASTMLVNSLSGLTTTDGLGERTYQSQLRYNSEWWLTSNLDTLVSLLNPGTMIPHATPKKPRAGAYSSPTHASTMKAVDPTKVRTSASRFPYSASRAPSPPPPEVDWATAAQEICKLLIPSDRQIHSCTALQLAGPKKEARVSSVTPERAPSRATTGRQLRDRNARAATKISSTDSDEDIRTMRSVSRTVDRRKTIAATESAANQSQSQDIPTERMRRMSIGSTVSNTSAAPSRTNKPPVPSSVQVKKTRAVATPRPPVAQRMPSSSRALGSKSKTPSIDASSTIVDSIEVDPPKPGPTKLKVTVKSAENKVATATHKPAATRKTPVARTNPTATAGKKPAVSKGRGVIPPVATTSASATPPTAAFTSSLPTPLEAQDSAADSLSSGLQGLALDRTASPPESKTTAVLQMPVNGSGEYTTLPLPASVTQAELPSHTDHPHQAETNGSKLDGQVEQPTGHPMNQFEQDALSNNNLPWGAPQTQLKWTDPMTLASEGEKKMAFPTMMPPAAPLAQPPAQPIEQQVQRPITPPLTQQTAPVLQPQQFSQTQQVQPQTAQERPATPRKAPVFSSTGHIPFSPSTFGASGVLLGQNNSASVQGNGHVQDADIKRENGVSVEETDLWEVPVTPGGK